jgi:hypothetical protein
MPSNLYTQHYVSSTAPIGAVLGDEWFNPVSSRLYKQMLANKVVSWVDITILNSSTTGTGNVVLSANPVLNNPTISNYTEQQVAIGIVGATARLSLDLGTLITATLTASTACTFTMPAAAAGKSFILALKQATVTGNGTATFTGVKWGTAGAPTITAAAGKMDLLTFVSDGVNWYGSASQGYTP